MPVFKDCLINADWTQRAVMIRNEQLWVMTFFFSALENVYLVIVWNEDWQEQMEQLKPRLLSTSHPINEIISVVATFTCAFCGLSLPWPYWL